MDLGFRVFRDACEHLFADRGGVLGPGVVVRDDDHVRETRGDLSHMWPLGAVAVSPGPHHHQQAPGSRDRSQSVEGLFERVRGVRVVDHAAAGRMCHGLHPSGDGAGLAEGAGHVRTGVSEGPQQQFGGECVGDVMPARQGRVQGAGPLGPVDGEDGAVVGGPDVAGTVVRVHARAGRVGDHRDLGLTGQAAPPLVIDADDPAAGVGRGEEGPLGLVVGLHRAVEVEVVLSEVGEADDVEDDLVRPMQHEGVAGDLHRDHCHLVLDHPGEQAVQLGRLGSGADGPDRVLRALAVPVFGAAGADGSSSDVEGVQGAGDDGGDRGLAVRAGHAQRGQLRGRAAMDEGRCGRRGRAWIVHLEHRQALGLAAGTAGGIGERHRGALACGLGGELCAVGVGSRQRAPEVAGLHRAGVEGDAVQRELGIGHRCSESTGEVRRRRALGVARTGRFGHRLDELGHLGLTTRSRVPDRALRSGRCPGSAGRRSSARRRRGRPTCCRR